MDLKLGDPRPWLISCIALVGACLFVFFLRKPSPPERNLKVLYPSSTTFRLQGIPAVLSGHPVSEENVTSLVKKAWNIDNDATITICSLATDPLDANKKIATLLFEGPPRFISRPELKWTKAVQWDAEGPIELTLDVEFFGLTPFHREADADCKYEWVNPFT